MRLIPSDPDVATIVSRIRDGDLDLQPNFQRGEVWSVAKKQKLIDSILREWHVPPIHVIQGTNGGKDEVLDGQQRLTAIRDFLDNKFKVNGSIEPSDPFISSLHGKRFEDLPEEWKRKIRRFPIRIFNIVDYRPSEPSELFYRLNQPVALTAAEQRNSFFGKPREQIKQLVDQMDILGLDKEFLGFSNSRMAYDDALARVCVALESGLGTKTGANLLADRYRNGEPFDENAYSRAAEALKRLALIKNNVTDKFKLNKASLFSWLIFCARAIDVVGLSTAKWAEFFSFFEFHRDIYGLGLHADAESGQIKDELFSVYHDRVTSRVADVSSVLLRDLAMWSIFVLGDEVWDDLYLPGPINELQRYLPLSSEIGKTKVTERRLLEFLEVCPNWEVVR